MPGRPGAGASFDSRTGNDGPAGIGLHDWIGMVGWLRIKSLPRIDQVVGRPLRVREWDCRALEVAQDRLVSSGNENDSTNVFTEGDLGPPG